MEKQEKIEEILSENTIILENADEVKELITMLEDTEIEADLLDIYYEFSSELPFRFYFFEGGIDGEYLPIGNPYISLSEFKEELSKEGLL